MNEQDFIEKMTEIMDTEYSFTMDTNLEDIEEWDSLSYVTFLTMCKSMQKKVAPDAIINAKKVRDLYELITEPAAC
ncbi:MAG TPA: hypothetical protein DEP57_02580 [Selenomonas sp.]|nr:hypothetical protein [Selenomonas sp.]